MGTDINLRRLLRATQTLARDARRSANRHHQVAEQIGYEATEIGRVADQIATLHVDASTITDTRETSRILRDLHDAATGYRTCAQETARTAEAANTTTANTHNGIQEAHDRAPVPMADRTWYGQE
ncbi:hypothetical protein [Kitasatospora cineracea]|uniref:Uncharacterized protein n=1 Tax=Kitasatospora cineracea TaxID=88074 RepID=A0A3N4R1V0_9ACTN|nr:hypothetical protein [Kitasatospora cineracea]RPE27308.1 hypothetical protein EDD38_7453 [Kitasatospora cineracea]